MAQERLLQELQETIGDAYEIERELGGGGMSQVFLATERSLKRKVVIKVLPPTLSSSVSAARFQREILVTANLQHPHILPVLAAGDHGGLHYYIMPFVEGQSLRDRLARDGALPIADGLQILRALASALAHAHARGVIHRDVKPENVLLSEGHPILADFGIAGATQRLTTDYRLTGTGQGPGTPGYMAPEQLVDAAAADPRVDVFSLGVVAYEMFAGKAPFAGPTPQALAASYFKSTPRPLSQLSPGVPPNVSAAISRALATNPEDRFANASEFLAAIRPPEREGAFPLRTKRGRMLFAAGTLLVAFAAFAAWRAGRLDGAATDEGGAERKMLVVLPFKNLSDPEDAYFADGVTEEVTSRLASLGGLGVISRTSADQYADSKKPLRAIARELSADYVLEGSVRWQRTVGGPGRVRVTPQLIRVSDDTHLWTETFDADLKDVFTVQSQIAERVAGALAVALHSAQRRQLEAQPTSNFAAYDAYMRAEALRQRENSNPVSLARAESLFTAAIRADSAFALAFAKLALVHMRVYDSFIDRSSLRLEAARAAADSALALTPELPEAHLALGRYHEGTNDLVRASAEYRLAEQGRPNDSQILISSGTVLARRGEWDEALSRFRRAARVDPRSVPANQAAAMYFGMTRNFRTAHAYAERAIAADSDAVDSYNLKAKLELLIAGDFERARATAREAMFRFGPERVVATEGFALLLPALQPEDRVPLERVSLAAFGGSEIIYHFWRVQLLETSNRPLALAHADTLRRLGDRLIREQPNSATLFAASGLLNAIVGDKDNAQRHARRALELAPRNHDVIAWCDAAFMAANTFVRIGDHDAAIDQLEQLLSAPSWGTVAYLKRDSIWAPLRTNPRFQRMLQRGS